MERVYSSGNFSYSRQKLMKAKVRLTMLPRKSAAVLVETIGGTNPRKLLDRQVPIQRGQKKSFFLFLQGDEYGQKDLEEMFSAVLKYEGIPKVSNFDVGFDELIKVEDMLRESLDHVYGKVPDPPMGVSRDFMEILLRNSTPSAWFRLWGTVSLLYDYPWANDQSEPALKYLSQCSDEFLKRLKAIYGKDHFSLAITSIIRNAAQKNQDYHDQLSDQVCLIRQVAIEMICKKHITCPDESEILETIRELARVGNIEKLICSTKVMGREEIRMLEPSAREIAIRISIASKDGWQGIISAALNVNQRLEKENKAECVRVCIEELVYWMCEKRDFPPWRSVGEELTKLFEECSPDSRAQVDKDIREIMKKGIAQLLERKKGWGPSKNFPLVPEKSPFSLGLKFLGATLTQCLIGLEELDQSRFWQWLELAALSAHETYSEDPPEKKEWTSQVCNQVKLRVERAQSFQERMKACQEALYRSKLNYTLQNQIREALGSLKDIDSDASYCCEDLLKFLETNPGRHTLRSLHFMVLKLAQQLERMISCQDWSRHASKFLMQVCNISNSSLKAQCLELVIRFAIRCGVEYERPIGDAKALEKGKSPDMVIEESNGESEGLRVCCGVQASLPRSCLIRHSDLWLNILSVYEAVHGYKPSWDPLLFPITESARDLAECLCKGDITIKELTTLVLNAIDKSYELKELIKWSCQPTTYDLEEAIGRLKGGIEKLQKYESLLLHRLPGLLNSVDHIDPVHEDAGRILYRQLLGDLGIEEYDEQRMYISQLPVKFNSIRFDNELETPCLEPEHVPAESTIPSKLSDLIKRLDQLARISDTKLGRIWKGVLKNQLHESGNAFSEPRGGTGHEDADEEATAAQLRTEEEPQDALALVLSGATNDPSSDGPQEESDKAANDVRTVQECLGLLSRVDASFKQELRYLERFHADEPVTRKMVDHFKNYWQDMSKEEALDSIRMLQSLQISPASESYSADRIFYFTHADQALKIHQAIKEILTVLLGSSHHNEDALIGSDNAAQRLQELFRSKSSEENDVSAEGGDGEDSVVSSSKDRDEIIALAEQFGNDFGDLAWVTGGSVLDSVVSESGKAFLGILLDSTLQNENFIAKLAELDDDDHTVGSLDDASAAIDFLQPIVYSACIVRNREAVPNIELQSHRTMDYRDQEEKLCQVRQKAKEVETKHQLARLTLDVLILLSKMEDEGLARRIMQALEQGKYLEEKIQLNENDADAVRHVIKGIVNTGEVFLRRPTANDSGYTIGATYEFRDQRRESVDELKLMECSDKAALIVSHVIAVEDERREVQNRVSLFKDAVRLVTGLKSHLTLLHQVGHPHLLHLLDQEGFIRLPLDRGSYGFREDTTMDEMREFHAWAVEANRRWRQCIKRNRDLSPTLSCIPASKIMPLIKLIIARQFDQAFDLMSSPPSEKYDATRFCEHDAMRLKQACDSVSRDRHPDDFALNAMMELLREMLDKMGVHPAFKRGGALERTLAGFRAGYSTNGFTTTSMVDMRNKQRVEPSFQQPGKALLVQEEESHDRLKRSDQVQTSITLFSVLFPLNLAPHPELILHCDIHTPEDDILRFFHVMQHCLQAPKGKPPTGVVVHADKLSLRVRQILCNELSSAQQPAKQARNPTKVKGMKIAITLTRSAPIAVVGMLEELSVKRKIPILKRSTVASVFESATKTSVAYQNTFIVRSAMPGQGKTHWIRSHPKWTSGAKTASFVWGGAQTRSLAAAALARALQGSPDCLHLEMFPFEDTGVDADLMTMELLLWRRVYDPQGGTWCRVPENTTLFVEIANTLMVKDYSLLERDAPLLWDGANHQTLTGNEPFEFPTDNDEAAKDFAIAGSALLMEEFDVCPKSIVRPAGTPENNTNNDNHNGRDRSLFQLESGDESGVVATRMGEMLNGRKDQVVERAKQVLQKVARESSEAQGYHYSCEPTKAMISNFLRQLSSWVAKWAHMHAVYKDYAEDPAFNCPPIEMCQATQEVLQQMVEMAAAVSLRSSAGQAQTKTFESRQDGAPATVDECSDSESLSALANRVVDIRTRQERAWTFNHGGALGIIGNRNHVPEKMCTLWKRYNRTMGGRDTKPIPPENLDKASQPELQKILLQSMSAPGRDHTAVENSLNDYVLHRDNMIKMVDMAERLKCGLPTLIMGEAGCGKTFLVRLAAKFMGIEIMEESVHAGTTVDDIARAIDKAEVKAQELENQNKQRDSPFVLLFFDELNTCSHLPIFKRLLIDRLHPQRQDSVHPHLRFVGACNPWRTAGKEEVRRPTVYQFARDLVSLVILP